MNAKVENSPGFMNSSVLGEKQLTQYLYTIRTSKKRADVDWLCFQVSVFLIALSGVIKVHVFHGPVRSKEQRRNTSAFIIHGCVLVWCYLWITLSPVLFFL